MLAAATQAYSQSTSGSCDGATGSSHSSAPPVDTNQIWYEAVDGKEKMLVYGVGSSTSSFYLHRRPDYEAPSSGPFSNLFLTMEDFQDAMRNAMQYQLADTERRMIDFWMIGMSCVCVLTGLQRSVRKVDCSSTLMIYLGLFGVRIIFIYYLIYNIKHFMN